MIDAAIETDTETEDVPVRPTTEAPDVATTRTAMRPAAAIASVSERTDTLAARDVAEANENGIATVDPPDAMPGETTMIARGETATRTTTDAEADETETRMPGSADANASGARRRLPRRGNPRLI